MSKSPVAMILVGAVIGAACAAGTIAACVAIQKAKEKKALFTEADFEVLEES